MVGRQRITNVNKVLPANEYGYWTNGEASVISMEKTGKRESECQAEECRQNTATELQNRPRTSRDCG
jgi:hypothetical protein